MQELISRWKQRKKKNDEFQFQVRSKDSKHVKLKCERLKYYPEFHAKRASISVSKQERRYPWPLLLLWEPKLDSKFFSIPFSKSLSSLVSFICARKNYFLMDIVALESLKTKNKTKQQNQPNLFPSFFPNNFFLPVTGIMFMFNYMLMLMMIMME